MSAVLLRRAVCMALWLGSVTVCGLAVSANLVVLDARGGGLKTGMRIDGSAKLVLKEGERVTLISPEGTSVTLKGPFDGLPMGKPAAASNPRQALGALVATREARATAVGVIRAGGEAVSLPEPWLIDVTRPGPRCLMEGERPVWWRPKSSQAESFTVFPVDRSWRAEFNWQAGQDRQAVPALSRFEGTSVFFIRQGEQEFAISLMTIPKGLDNDLMLASWLLEKGCLQQADALLAGLRHSLPASQ